MTANEIAAAQQLTEVDSDQGASTSDEFSGLSPNALRIEFSPDMIGLWRLRKSLALDDAAWALKSGRKDIATQCVRGARFCHREIMRILEWRRTRKMLAQMTPALPVKSTAADDQFDTLAPRERQFVQLLGRGKSVDAIAGEMGIKAASALTYRFTIAAKLGVKTKELTEHVVRQGWGA